MFFLFRMRIYAEGLGVNWKIDDFSWVLKPLPSFIEFIGILRA